MERNAEARIAALLFSSAVVFLLLARRDAVADLVLAAVDRFLLDGRGLLDLATRRNMVLLCHAILLLILRDVGVLGAPARRRGASPGAATAIVAAAADSDSERGVVVWRPPRNRAAAARDADRQVPAEAAAAATWAAPAPASMTGPAQAEDSETNKQLVLVEQAATNHLAAHDRAATIELEQKDDGDKGEFHRRIIVASDERNASAVAEQAEEMPELADDRRIEEFIAKQWSKMRQESLQLVIGSSPGSQLAVATC